jgi:hypothetical protein
MFCRLLAVAALVLGLVATTAHATEFVSSDAVLAPSVRIAPWTVKLVQPAVLVASLGFDSVRELTTSVCPTVTTPPPSIATLSKYDQADRTRSTLGDAAGDRDATLQPIRNAIRLVVGTNNYKCAVAVVSTWAAAGSLTSMLSEDAYLTRDRFVAEIAMMLMDADRAGAIEPRQRVVIDTWLAGIAQSTMDFYAYRAGPNAKRNNHRYWAGLSVGAIAFLTGDTKLRAWADHSFALGVCQVDQRGYLPLELARGSQALNYHVYALRPLMAYADLAARNGARIASECNNGLARLVAATQRGLDDPAIFADLVGKDQAHLPSEKSYSARLQLATLGLAS